MEIANHCSLFAFQLPRSWLFDSLRHTFPYYTDELRKRETNDDTNSMQLHFRFRLAEFQRVRPWI